MKKTCEIIIIKKNNLKQFLSLFTALLGHSFHCISKKGNLKVISLNFARRFYGKQTRDYVKGMRHT